MPNRLLALAIAASWLGITAGSLPAQIFQQDRAVTLTAENDALGGSSDSSYTNGIRVRWTFMQWNARFEKVADVLSGRSLLGANPGEASSDDACSLVGGRSDRPCGFVSFSVNQTMYTPSTLLDTMPRPDERPYAGMAFASLGLHQPGRFIHTSTELVLGMIGPWSGAEATQSLAHWTWSTGSAKPRGWRNQLRNRPQVGIINQYAVRLPFPGEFCVNGCDGSYDEARVFDFTGTGELALGTHMRRASAGYVVRVGFGFPDLLGVDRISTTGFGDAQTGSTVCDLVNRFKPWFFLFLSQDGRHVFYSAFLEGTPADVGAGGWRDISVITPRRNLGETARGFSVGFGSLTVTYQKVQRSTEYTTDGGRHTYGSLSLSLSTAARPGGS